VFNISGSGMRMLKNNLQLYKNTTGAKSLNHTKDLSWLGAPAFLLILCILFFQAKKQGFSEKHRKQPSHEITISMISH
jgi:hypothetical protein